jgi:hypothetical protein
MVASCLSSKAVLKPPHSKRWRDSRAAQSVAKRLDCGAFTAAIFLPGVGRISGLPWGSVPKIYQP